MKYSNTIPAFMFLSALCLCITGAVYSMEQSKEPTDYFEFQAVLDDTDNVDDTNWVFRAYKNGENGIPPQFKKTQQASVDLDSIDLDNEELES